MSNDKPDHVIEMREFPPMPVATAWVERAGVWGAEQIAGLLHRAITAEHAGIQLAEANVRAAAEVHTQRTRALELSAELERRTALLDQALELLDEQREHASTQAFAFAEQVRASTRLARTATATIADARGTDVDTRPECKLCGTLDPDPNTANGAPFCEPCTERLQSLGVLDEDCEFVPQEEPSEKEQREAEARGVGIRPAWEDP